MCSDPQTNPKTGDVFSCRRCNQCISRRRFDWVSRAMAEKDTSAQTLCVTLTYNAETQENRDGATMFRYKDIKDFFKRVRDAVFRKTGQAGLVRYLVAGEQGDRNGRCHWHCVIFSQVDLTTLGVISDPYTGELPAHFVTAGGEVAVRVHWSIWGRGFVTFQQPDEGGMHYALTYALKDQFAADKAKGTAREAKSEAFGTGMFRVSKSPPIGLPFIERLLGTLQAQGSVLPNTNLRVPDLRGYWRPTGLLRKHLLTGLREINEATLASTGRDCAQWSSLLSSCQTSDQDLEILHGKIEEEETVEDIVRRRVSQNADDGRQRYLSTIRRKCGSKAPCNACIRGGEGFGPYRAFEAFTDDLGQVRHRYAQDDPTGSRLRGDQTCGGGRSPHALCQKADTYQTLDAFAVFQSAP